MEINNLTQIIIENINSICENLLLKQNNKIVSLNIEYFYDGESIDLGIKIYIYEKTTEEIQAKYFSFVFDNNFLEKELVDFLSNFNENEKFTKLRLLAEKISCCLDKKLYCFEEIEEITVQCYD